MGRTTSIVRYLHDFWVDLSNRRTINPNPVAFLDYFPKLNMKQEEKYGLEEFNKVCGVRDPGLQKVCRYKFCVYLCDI